MRTRHWILATLLFIMFIMGTGAANAQLTVNLAVSPATGQVAGLPAALEASAAHGGTELPVYQFSFRERRGKWRIARDFDPNPRFDWASLIEGEYQVRVIARLLSTGETLEATRSYRLTSAGRVAPAVLPTSHPLVALYSAPPCSTGWMRVRFRYQHGTAWQYTLLQSCTASKALNFYVAGMRPGSTYVLQHQNVISATEITDGAESSFQTGSVINPIPTIAVTQMAPAGVSFGDSAVVHAFANLSPVATDLTGALIWYYAQPDTLLFRALSGGNMLLEVRDEVGGRILREIDIAGNVVRETNSVHVSRQLVALGHDPIGVFHHDAIRLPNGHTLALASVERILTDVQGPGSVNVYGEMIVALDENFQVLWAWNSFEKLDAARAAILGETCTSTTPGCPALFLAPVANDWLHANAIAYSPSDRNIIVSLRHQDWIIKIDYRDGAGSGDVLWRLGEGGDFTMVAHPSHGAWPWFSHQHDPKIGGSAILVYDNGNTRVEGPAALGGHSRGQALLIDEAALTATLVLNYDLGTYSRALGSAQRLSNGNLFFGNGLLGGPAQPLSQGLELSLDGSPKFSVAAAAFTYRVFRMKDLYRP